MGKEETIMEKKEMNILEKVESLRSEKTPEEIEEMLLNGSLGKIHSGNGGYQYIEDLQLSWLVVEAHEPGFIREAMRLPVEHVTFEDSNN